MDTFLDETFDGTELDPRLNWFCMPEHWGLDPVRQQLWITPEGGTDFWQQTHYGFRADNGHFLYASFSGDFVLSTEVTLDFKNQYDQAGLMIRFSENCWLKTSVEYEPDGPCRLGAVVTNHGYSDWSTQDFPKDAPSLRLRVQRGPNDYTVEAGAQGSGWTQLRVAPLHEDADGKPAQAGLYACSPKGAGFRAAFSYLCITSLPEQGLQP